MSNGLEQASLTSHPNARIVSLWALDSNEHATRALRENLPHAHVHHAEADVALKMARGIERMHRKAGKAGAAVGRAPARNPASYDRDADKDRQRILEKILDVGVFETEAPELHDAPITHRTPREADGDDADVDADDAALLPQLHFRVLVKWKAPAENAVATWEDCSWEPLSSLTSCPDAISEFLNNAEQRHNTLPLPRPGEVGILAGGPPCQGVSGKNVHRVTSGSSVNNAQTGVFCDWALFLKSRLVFMENVADLFKFQDGMYGRACVRALVDGGYQVCVSATAAAAHGCAQGRLRVFVVAAAPGEVLPPAPLPTHDCSHAMRHVLPNEHTECMLAAFKEHGDVDLKKELQRYATIGDAISDLQDVPTSCDVDAAPPARRVAVAALPAMQAALARPRPGHAAAPSSVVPNHFCADLSDLQKARLALVPPGGNHHDIRRYVQANPTKGIFRCKRTGKTYPLATAAIIVRARPAGRTHTTMHACAWRTALLTTLLPGCVHAQTKKEPASSYRRHAWKGVFTTVATGTGRRAPLLLRCVSCGSAGCHLPRTCIANAGTHATFRIHCTPAAAAAASIRRATGPTRCASGRAFRASRTGWSSAAP
jgi:site-specific DNA-cytosine methylase